MLLLLLLLFLAALLYANNTTNKISRERGRQRRVGDQPVGAPHNNTIIHFIPQAPATSLPATHTSEFSDLEKGYRRRIPASAPRSCGMRGRVDGATTLSRAFDPRSGRYSPSDVRVAWPIPRSSLWREGGTCTGRWWLPSIKKTRLYYCY